MICQQKIFTKEECEKIISYSKEIKDTYDSLIEKIPGVNYFAYNIKNTEKYNWIFHRLLNFFTESTKLNIKKLPNILHLHRYNENCVFVKHHDKNYPSRIWNVGVQLSDDYTGGDLNLYYENKVTVGKEIGNSYIFEPEIFHEVTKITKGTRWSLILFLEYENVFEELNKKSLF